MRRVLIVLTALAAVLLSVNARAKQRMFIVAGNADGYGVDRCLEAGAKCGAAIAAAYCKSRQFIQAASYRRVERDELTGSIPSRDSICHSGNCNEFVAIICSR